MNISLDKKYRTRDGREARVLCVDRKTGSIHPAFTVVAAVVQPDGTEMIGVFTEKGVYHNVNFMGHDLIEIREPREWKVSECKKGRIYSYDDGDELRSDYARVFTVREVIEEGQP